MQKSSLLRSSILVSVACLLSVSGLLGHAQTEEERELILSARQHRFKRIKSIVSLVKESWETLEHFHKGIFLNKRVRDVLVECWRNAYARNDSSYSVKITQQDMMKFFEQFLIEIDSSISYYQQRKALDGMRNDAYKFSREPQQEYRETIEKASKLILKHLAPHIPSRVKNEFTVGTERVFKDGIRFLFFVMLKRYNKGFTSDDEQFINAKMDMFLHEMGCQYPYIAASQFESWAFAMFQDLLFGECRICMDKKADKYLSCCKTRTICKKCYAYMHECPLCRAPLRK